jgi:hypothetical protein
MCVGINCHVRRQYVDFAERCLSERTMPYNVYLLQSEQHKFRDVFDKVFGQRGELSGAFNVTAVSLQAVHNTPLHYKLDSRVIRMTLTSRYPI